MAWEAEEGHSSALAPATQMGGPGGGPGSWLQQGSALASVAIWAVN